MYVIDDFRKLTIFGDKKEVLKVKIMNKGHYEELVEFAKAIREGKNHLIPLEQLICVTEMTFKINKLSTENESRTEDCN